jgi:hypothetical protein
MNGTIFQIQQQLPYLEFLILKMALDTPTALDVNITSHDLQSIDDKYNGFVYRIYGLKSHKVSNEKGVNFKLIEYRQSYLHGYKFSNMKVDQICKQGLSVCAFKIYVSGGGAGCFHEDRVVSSRSINDCSLSPFVVLLSIFFEITSFMTI